MNKHQKWVLALNLVIAFALSVSGAPSMINAQGTSSESRCPKATFGTCIIECISDDDCSNGQKCCSNGCGQVCTEPVFPPKPGKCPAPDGFGLCIQRCSADEDCAGSEKCCFNGCGHECMEPQVTMQLTPLPDLTLQVGCKVNGKFYPVGSNFPADDGCKTCSCTGPNQYHCTLIGCGRSPCPPGKPMVFCFVDPCLVNSCPAHPDAKCVADYCGGCFARFYNSAGDEVTATCNLYNYQIG